MSGMQQQPQQQRFDNGMGNGYVPPAKAIYDQLTQPNSNYRQATQQQPFRPQQTGSGTGGQK